MAVRAARQAFERAGADPSTLDLLFHVSVFHQGPDGWLPQSYIQRELGLDPHAMAVELRQGCNGMFTGLELAISHLRADAARGSALLTAAENFNSALVDRWTAHPGSYLGDSGSAVLLTRRPGFARLRSVATVSVPELEQLHRGDEALFPRAPLSAVRWTSAGAPDSSARRPRRRTYRPCWARPATNCSPGSSTSPARS